MGLFLCPCCDQNMFGENVIDGKYVPHVCKQEDIEKHVVSLRNEISSLESKIFDISDKLELFVHNLPSLDGKIDGKIIQELWELCVTHGYPSAESAECFLSRWLVTHRILIEAYDLFRERDSSTILQRLEELEKACRDSQDIMGYNDSKLTLTSKDLINGLGT